MLRPRGILALAAALGAPVAVAACLGTTEPSACGAGIPVSSYPVGDTASDSLTSQLCRHLYQFTADSQLNLRFTVTSHGLQTFLQLLDQRGAIVMNSALTTSLDTVTTVRAMLGKGGYALSVNVVNQGDQGTFRVWAATDTTPVSGCAPVWVTSGVTTAQTITTGDCTNGPAGTSYYTHEYLMVLLQLQEVSITMTSTSYPPRVLLTGGGNTASSTADSTGTSAVLANQILAQDAYTIWAGSQSAGQTGKYTLQIQ